MFDSFDMGVAKVGIAEEQAFRDRQQPYFLFAPNAKR